MMKVCVNILFSVKRTDAACVRAGVCVCLLLPKVKTFWLAFTSVQDWFGFTIEEMGLG